MTLTHEQKLEIGQSLALHLEHPDHTSAELARALNLNSGTVSLVKNGKTDNGGSPIKDEVYLQIAKAVGYEVADDKGTFEFLPNYELPQLLAAKLMSDRRNGILDSSGSGHGKTFALRAFAEGKSAARTIYVQINQGTSPKELCGQIIERLGETPIGPLEQRISHLRQLVARRPGMLLIIDEMECAKHTLWMFTKTIADICSKRWGILLSGYQLVRIMERRSKSGAALSEQIQRRFSGEMVRLDWVSVEQVRNMCRRQGIKDPKVAEWLQRRCSNLQQLTEWMEDLQRYQASENSPAKVEDCEYMFSAQAF